MHDSLINIFEISQQCRKHDIMKVVRFNDFRQGHSSAKGKIPVMKEDKLNCETEKEIDIQALVFIECIDDKEIKENCRKYFTSLGKKDIKKKETILSNLLEENYECCSEITE